MTTIAIDFIQKKLYMDSRATYKNISAFGLTFKEEKTFDCFNKIFYEDSNTVITGTGSVYDILRFMKTNKLKHLGGNTECWKITKFPFKLEVYQHDKKTTYPQEKDTIYLVSGSGAHHVKSIFNFEQKVRNINAEEINMVDVITCIADKYSGGEIRCISVSDKYLFEDMFE
jgi:hypothetical protein